MINTREETESEAGLTAVFWRCLCIRSEAEIFSPDGVAQVMPAQVDGSGAVLDRLIQRRRAGLDQKHAGHVCVTVDH